MATYLARCLRPFVYPLIVSMAIVAGPAAMLRAQEAAPATSEAKPAEAAPATPAEAKPPEAPAAPPPEAKPAESPPAEAKPAAETETKAPEPKPAQMPAPAPAEAKPAEAKPAEAKPAEAKPAEAKPAEAKPAEAKPAEAKPAEAKPAEAKPAEAKPAEAKPAEAKPAEAKPAETAPPTPAPQAPAAPPLPDFNYEELARPPVARRLELTEQQKSQITGLLSERADALAKAPEDQREAVGKENDKKLAAVLSQEQMADFAKQQAEPRLQFNFRFQRWADVLEWIAEQADLSLVIEAPPPGTFNYSDTREYTPTEAIDLLNSVLITKGYALIRRDRMLIVVDLKSGVSEDMIPRVDAKDLEQRGKFELVSTLFPLGARDAEAVEKEIAPLLGPHGKALVLPATKQLLVTTTAGAMQAIGKVIDSIPEPKKPEPRPEKPAEKSELVVHPVGSADPQAAMEVLKALFASANIVLDPKTSQINAYAPSSQQEAIKKVLEQMQGAVPEEQRPKLEVYTVDQPGADQLITTIKSMLPEAQLSIDPTTGKLVAWAKPADQETIKTTLEKLRGLGSPDQTRQLQVYRLTRVDPTNAQTMLSNLVPTARLSVDTRTRSLIALASPADQETIKTALEKLQPGEPGSNAPELRLYPVDEIPSAAVLSALTALVPDAQVTPEPEKKRLMVVATPAEHEVIKKTLDQAAESPANARQLVAYPIETADPTSTLTMLQGLLPTVQFVLDPKTNRLLAWARPSEQETIKSALLQIQADAMPETQPRFETYAIQKSQAAEILSTLQTLVPNARLSLDPKSEKLIAWGAPSDHQQIKTAIEKLQVTASPQTTPQLEVYRLSKLDPTALVTTLQNLVPDAKLTADSSTRTLVALAIPEDQETIRSTLEQLQSDERRPDAPELRYYALKQRPPDTLIPGLQQLAPEAQITLGADGLRLMVVAPPSQHEAIKTALDQMATSSEDSRQLVAYPLQAADPTSTVTMLQNLMPTAQFVVDSKTNRLLAWAWPSEHEAIKTALAQIESDAAPGNRPRFEAYPIPKAQASEILSTLQSLVPSARLTLDPKSDQLIAWGNPSDHEQVKAALEKLQATVSPETTPQLEVYRLTKADPGTTLTLLQNLLPDAELTVDATAKTLIALAVPEDQQTIQAMLDQLQSDERAPNAPELRYYTLKQRPPSSLITGLQALAPTAQITLNEDGLQMMVVAPPAEHDLIKSTIEKVETTAAPEEQSTLAVYQVTPSQKARFQAILPNLTEELPGMQSITDATPGELSIWAKPAQQRVVAQVIEELKRESPLEGQYELVAYPVKAADPEIVVTTLQSVFPNVQFVVDKKTRRIMVWTDSAQQKAIQAAIEQMDSAVPAEFEESYKSYPVSRISPQVAMQALQERVPDAKLIQEPTSNRIIALAIPADHKQIADTLEQMQETQDGLGPKLVVYPTGDMDATSLSYLLRTLVPAANVVVDSKTGGLAAFATPEDHKTIQATIDEMAKDAVAGDKPTMVTYSIENMTAADAMRILATAVPKAQLSQGADTHQLVAWAKASDHEIIERLVGQLSAEGPPETAPRMETYDIGKLDSMRAMFALRAMAPSAIVAPGVNPGQMIAWGRPADHEKIQEALAKLADQGLPENAATLAVYPLKEVTASSAMSVLQTVAPHAQLSVGSTPNLLVAYARPADHEVIKASLAQIDIEDPDKQAMKVVVYKLTGRRGNGLSYTFSFLRSAVPDASLTLGADPTQLVVWATPEDHQEIEELIKKISELPPEETPSAVVYTLGSGLTVSSVTQVLSSAVPEARITTGSDPQQLIAFAKPEDHKTIEEVLSTLSAKEPAETAPTMVVYPLKNVQAQDAIRLLSTIIPQAKLNSGSDAKQIVAYARPADHEVIKASLEKIDAQDNAATVVMYNLKGKATYAGSYYTLAFLRSAVPEATFTVGADSSQLVVWAKPEQHERIKQLVDEFSKELPPEETPTTVVYTVTNGTSAGSVMSMVSSAVPEARLSLGSDPQKLVAFAKPDEHEIIREMVDKLSAKEPPETAPTMVVYPLKNVQAQDAIRVLSTIVPQAKLNSGSDSKQLVAYARPADHEVIKSSLAEIDSADNAATAVVYTLKGKATYANSYYTLAFLRSAVPEATFTVGADSSQLVVWAKPEQHERIKQLVDEFSKELPPEETPTTVVYTLGPNTTAATASQMLRSAVPEAGLSVGSDPQKLIAFAKPEDHKIIAEAVEEMSAEESPDTAPSMVVYPLNNVEAQSAIRVLSAIVPQARLNSGSEANQLVAYARPPEHELIKKSLAEIDKEDQKATAVVYTLKGRGGSSRSSYYFYQFLSEAIPEAKFTRGADSNQLVVWATPAMHEKVKQLVEQLTTDLPPEQTPTMAVYTLESTPASSALSILQSAFPEATFTSGSDPRTLIAWAIPADQKKIEAAVGQLSQETTLVDSRTMAVYPLKGRDADALMRVLQPVIRDHAAIAVDPNRNSLIVWADKQYHESIKKTIDEFTQQVSTIEETTSRVYRFEVADPQAAYTVLQTLVPDARIALDDVNRSLVVSAMPEDHKKIQATVDEMEREDQSQAPRMEVYQLTAADPTNLLNALQGMFRRRSDVQISLDQDNGSVIAFASPIEQKKIRELIEQIEKLATGETAARLELYSLENVDTDAAMEVLTSLMQKQGAKVRLSVEPRSEQLVAFARPEQHELIASTLEQLRSEEDQFEIFQLDLVDPMSADLAISRLFSDDYWTAPMIDVDPITQQLLVRGKPDQLEEIRRLLIKMGETGLAATPGSSSSNLRTIRIQGDVQATIAEIQRVWPQLRQNDLQIFNPTEGTPSAASSVSPESKTAEPSAKLKESRPADVQSSGAEKKKEPQKKGNPAAEKPAEPAKDQSSRSGSAWRGVFRLASFGETASEKAAANNPGEPAEAKAASRKPESASTPQQPQKPASPPVVIMPGDGQITIASDDPEALNELESLLRSLSEPRGEIGRNFHIFPLKHTNAYDVADTVEDLFRENQSRYGWRRGMSPVVVVPDERMNAILVQANRTDRATIENLLKVIDTDEVPESPDAHRPRIIPIENTDAERVEEVVRGVFRSQLTLGSRRSSRTGGPSSAWTPQITVDRITNSLVVMASAPLVDDITELAQSLDEAAGSEPARAVTLVPLKKTNSSRVQEALDQILRGSRTRRYRSDR